MSENLSSRLARWRNPIKSQVLWKNENWFLFWYITRRVKRARKGRTPFKRWRRCWITSSVNVRCRPWSKSLFIIHGWFLTPVRVMNTVSMSQLIENLDDEEMSVKCNRDNIVLKWRTSDVCHACHIVRPSSSIHFGNVALPRRSQFNGWMQRKKIRTLLPF